MRRALAAAIALLLATCPSSLLRAQQAAFRIVVITGEDAVNIVQQKTATAPVVEVRDRNDQPVAGVIVRFAIRNGRATFDGARTLSVTTNAVGRATAAGLTPTGTGSIQIGASAAFQGQTAAVTIAQTNVMTAAQAAGAGAGAGSGGGGIGPGTISAIAAGAAGGIFAYRELAADGPPPAFVQLRPIVATGLQSSTVFALDFDFNLAEGPCGHKQTYDWGDGVVVSFDGRCGSGQTPPTDQINGHVYQTAGTFTIRMTIADDLNREATAETSVTVKSMSGRWSLGATGNFYDLVQIAETLQGTFTTASGAGSGSVSGSITPEKPGIPNLLLRVLAPSSGSPSTYSSTTLLQAGPARDTVDALAGTFTSGTGASIQTLRRQ